jgi:DNA-binding PadR family transcriptional regulator
MSTTALTPTSYIVLGLLERHSPATSYELKRAAAGGVGYFWSIPHTQLYNEPSRLAAAGYLDQRQETTGRRRKLYTLTDKGRDALDAWRSQPTKQLTELRDPGLLQLFFGADPLPLAEDQLAAHTQQLATYQDLRDQMVGQPNGTSVSLIFDAGIGHEREWIRFWRDVIAASPKAAN